MPLGLRAAEALDFVFAFAGGLGQLPQNQLGVRRDRIEQVLRGLGRGGESSRHF